MSRQAILKLPLVSKEPKPHDLQLVLEIADRLLERDARPATRADKRQPDNVIPFPGRR